MASTDSTITIKLDLLLAVFSKGRSSTVVQAVAAKKNTYDSS